MKATSRGDATARAADREGCESIHDSALLAPTSTGFILAAGLVFALGSSRAPAAGWQLLPAANLQIGYDDNPQSVSTGAEGSFLTTLNASLRALRSTEASDVGLGLGFTANTYLDAADLDNTSGYANLDLGYRLERHRFGLGLGFITQSTLYAQGSESRLNQSNQQQQTLTLSPSWGFQATERTSLDLAMSLQDVTFEDAGPVSETGNGGVVSTSDYRSGSVNLGVGHTLTERLALTGTLGYDRYETQDITNEYDNYRLLAGANYQLSEISSLAFQAGIRFTEQTIEDPLDGRTLTQDSSGPTFNLSYSRRFRESGSFNLAAIRDLSPTGEGDVTDTTGLSASISVQPSPNWQVGVTASAYRSRSPSGETARGDETSYSIGPSLSYRIAESWGLSLGYLFTHQDLNSTRDLGDTGGNADSNAVYLNLSWTPRPWNL